MWDLKKSKARRLIASEDVLKEVQAKRWLSLVTWSQSVDEWLKEAQAKVAKSQSVDVRLKEVQTKAAKCNLESVQDNQ